MPSNPGDSMPMFAFPNMQKKQILIRTAYLEILSQFVDYKKAFRHKLLPCRPSKRVIDVGGWLRNQNDITFSPSMLGITAMRTI